MASRVPPASRLHIASRIAAALLGGYAFAWGVHALVMAALYAAGMEFHDAEFTGAATALLVYVAVFLWAFAATRLGRVWIVLAGGGVAMVATASWIQSMVT